MDAVFAVPVSFTARLVSETLICWRRVFTTDVLYTDKIGFVGAAVSDVPGLGDLCRTAERADAVVSFSSLRADALDHDLIAHLSRSHVKTATIAPDAGSERLRRCINKGITEDDILTAAEALVANGIPNLKLYFMIGLPTETMDDIDAIVNLCKKVKHVFLKSSRAKGRIGGITVSINSFVPKPHTPFQWAAMDEIRTLKRNTSIFNRVSKAFRMSACMPISPDGHMCRRFCPVEICV